MKHLIELSDLSAEEIEQILSISSELKLEFKHGKRRPIFAGKVLGLLFEKPSLRTRVSFEALMNQHQGASLYLGADVGWQQREPLRDFVPVLTSYLDFLVIRAKSHEDVVAAASLSRCPIINGLTDYSHPCQALADLLTVRELLGGLDNVRLAYVGDANNVARSLAVICARLGVELAIACPVQYQFPESWVNELNRAAGRRLVWQTENPQAAVKGVHFVYTDVWASMGQEAEQAQRVRDFSPFQVTTELLALADPDVKFLHCLPARRGEEVAAEVIDGPASAIVLQAENRLHAQKGMLAWLQEQQR
jgi:ornithine carbamoyltransferase